MIDWLFKHLQPGIKYVILHPFTVLVICFSLAIGGFLMARNLRIDNDLSKLIPQDYPSVQALNKLREQVGGEHEAVVAIHSPSFEINKRFAEALIPRALALTNPATGEPYFTRAEFRRNIDFLKQNALYFATGEELDQLQEYLENQIEESRRKANPFYFELEEEEAETDSLGEELNQRYNELVGSAYTMSSDSTVLAIKLFPSGSQTDLGFIRNAYADLENLIADMNPDSYHPQMEVAAAGRLLRTLIEIETITADVFDSFGAGVLMLLIAVVLYFYYKGYRARYGQEFRFRWAVKQLTHTPAHALIMALPLIFSLCWTFGIAWMAYGTLNVMTSTLGLLLFGMGIDFGIHFYARYSEERGNGHSVEQSILTTFMTTGQAIFVVGLTTAAAFFILMIAAFKGFSEFGFIAGIGLLFAILSYLVFLPALIVLLEKSPLLTLASITVSEATSNSESNIRPDIRLRWRVLSIGILAVAIGVTTLSFIKLDELSFEYDFAELEPTYEEFNRRNALVWRTYSDTGTRNSAYIIVDRPEDAPVVANLLRERAKVDTLTPTIRSVETFQDRYPFSTEKAQAKLARIAEIRKLLNDPFLESSEKAANDLERLKTAAGTHSPIPLNEVPEFLKSPFSSTSGAIGNLVIIHPSVGLADGRNSMAFADDVGEVTMQNGNTYYAGSTSIVASDMLRLMIDEAPLMVALTLLFIVLFKVIILRGFKWMFLALLPLAASFIWLFGIMETVGWKLNFYNLVVLPTILGIGDDSGIHIVHRYLEEGKGSIMRVLHSTGEHITVSTFTTMLGFGGLLFSIHPGMRSIGEVAILGVGLALFAALFVLPSLLKGLEQFDAKNPAQKNKATLRVREKVER
ncbi:MMPL family transporter [Aliifodinibius sp. S!AR15-10]|uniref:efflux RND transporter permease subunit n=1 Tax=Aliifodinibius sp. S!AR15-10 TaxID=2950437 RepID=UPI00285B0567|nr:MMPL family transporter [Aliifodinibius sp. S!AR15-10]MDR8393998.1 MMPL family transporter [Aliifodinibius sp. S!AR15-10]